VIDHSSSNKKIFSVDFCKQRDPRYKDYVRKLQQEEAEKESKRKEDIKKKKEEEKKYREEMR